MLRALAELVGCRGGSITDQEVSLVGITQLLAVMYLPQVDGPVYWYVTCP